MIYRRLLSLLMKTNRAIQPYIWYVTVVAFLGGCSGKTGKNHTSDGASVIQVTLEPTVPSYKDIFERVEVIELESNPMSLIGYLDKTICIGDSIVILDMGRSSVFMFSPEGRFLNTVGQRGDGPEDYLMCYDIAYNSSTHDISVLEPRGTFNNYSLSGRFVGKHKLPSKPNYMACEWQNAGRLVLWSAVNEDECGVSVVDVKSGETIFEDWKRDRMLDLQRLQPFYRYRDEVRFCPPLTNDVYAVDDTGLRLEYTWKFTPDNIRDKYLNEIAAIENPQDKNQRLIDDFRNGNLKDVPTSIQYYVALQTGIGEEARYLSVFHGKKDNRSIVFYHFKEGITLHPLFLNEDFMLCRIPYDEVDAYNELTGQKFTCEEDENPLLAKFYFKK